MRGSHGAAGPDGGAARRESPGRTRVEQAALRLFADEGVSETSLQKIADALGVTKAAVYWHYKSKDEIVLAALRPALQELERLADAAEAERSRRARVELLVTGIVDLLLSNRRGLTVLVGDVAVRHLLEQDPSLIGVVGRIVDLLSGPDHEPGARVAATLFLAGLPGPTTDPGSVSLGDDELREHLLESGRRLLTGRRSTR
ncbi:TetR/AcrR family transcriptional regulator [Candidatus Blastococcus massiliensis]|uniref:TetR/AcrR family transcriptional regulator n=1 Tax=Candidatus Blastococcus massiliensis TaxID=1470358 RepID=UPI000686EBD7|nr:TetR/AcrR family transcriptional regulator [Candidatus Blastococcus massiliensis]